MKTENNTEDATLQKTIPMTEYNRLLLIAERAIGLRDAVTARMSANRAEEKLVWEMYQAHRQLSDALDTWFY